MAFHLARNAQYNNRPAALALVVRKSLNNQGLKPLSPLFPFGTTQVVP